MTPQASGAVANSVVFHVTASQVLPLDPIVTAIKMNALEPVVYSLDLEAKYDPLNSSVRQIRLGSLSSRMSLAVNTNRLGVVLAALASPTAISGEGTVLEIVWDTSNRFPMQLMHVLVNEGTIPSEIRNVARVRGQVRYFAGTKNISGVSLDVGVTGVNPASSATDGSFELTLDAGNNNNYTLQPSKAGNDPPESGVTGNDIVQIRRHIVGNPIIPGALTNLSPYSILAADVDGNNTVNGSDITAIRRVIVGLATSFTGPMWRFVRSDHQFADPLVPWTYNKTRTITSLISDLSNLDFLALKAGDVDGSWASITTQGFGTDRIDRPISLFNVAGAGSKTVTVSIVNGLLLDGSLIRVPLKVGGFKNVTSVQFTLRWDPQVLDYFGVTEFGLPDLGAGHFGTTRAGEGKLGFEWDDATGVGLTLEDASVIFAVELKRRGDAAPQTWIEFGDSPTFREVSIDAVVQKLVTEDAAFQVGSDKPTTRLILLEATATQPAVLAVQTVLGRRYTLESSSYLKQTDWKSISQIVGDGCFQRILEVVPNEPSRFYRVRIE